jgi:hypothetical protein
LLAAGLNQPLCKLLIFFEQVLRIGDGLPSDIRFPVAIVGGAALGGLPDTG